MALLTASMVSMVEAIGFVGLVIPHAARFLVGAVFLVLADVAARIVVPNQVLPIVVVTALVGAPGFAIILIRGRRGRG